MPNQASFIFCTLCMFYKFLLIDQLLMQSVKKWNHNLLFFVSFPIKGTPKCVFWDVIFHSSILTIYTFSSDETAFAFFKMFQSSIFWNVSLDNTFNLNILHSVVHIILVHFCRKFVVVNRNLNKRNIDRLRRNNQESHFYKIAL